MGRVFRAKTMLLSNLGGSVVNRAYNPRGSKYLSPLIFIVLLTIFIFSRSMYLDRDLPPNGISSYITMDELYYTIPAFNLFHQGEVIDNTVPLLDTYSSKDMQPVNILENLFTYVSLIIFGNNYYGLRFASTIAALISFILIYLVLRRILNNGSTRINHVLYFVMVYLLFDFAFLMAGRVAEPTIFRMMAMLAVIYIASLSCFSGTLESIYRSMLLGFISMATVLFVYLYNVFIFVAMLATVIVWAKKGSWNNVAKQTAAFLLGAIFCIFSYQWYIDVSYSSSIAEVYQYISPFQVRMGVGAGVIDSIRLYLMNTITILMTNIFRFNIVLLLALLLSLSIFIKRVKKEQANFEVLIFNLLLFLVMQSVVINDYPLRKLIMILPLAIIIVAISHSKWFEFYAKKKANEEGSRIANLYLFACFLICMSIWTIYFVSISQSGHFEEVRFSMYLNLIVFLIVSFLFLWYRQGKSVPALCIWICLVLVFLPNIYLGHQYVFSNRTYYYKEAMIKMAQHINGEVTIGGCSYGFRLYNESKPVLDSYVSWGSEEDYNQLFEQLFEQGVGAYSIAYTNDDNNDSLMGAAYMEKRGLELIGEYELGEAADTNVGLYRLHP